MKIALVGLLAVSMFKGCELGPHIQTQMQEGLQPYFPKAQVKVFPDQNVIAALTCLDNAGDELVKMVGPLIDREPQLAQLRLIRMVPGNDYRFIGLGFDHALVVYNVDNHAWVVQQMNAQYTETYRKECNPGGGSEPVASSINLADRPVPSGRQVYVFVGHFTLKVANGGSISTRQTVESLGIWPDETTFQLNKAWEMSGRKHVIRQYLNSQGESLVHMNLDSVEKVSITVQ